MSLQPSTEFDPAQTLDLWIYVPPVASILDLDTWADVNVASWALATGSNGAMAARVDRFLRGVVTAGRTAGYPYRFVFLVDPDFGAAVFDVALAEALPWADMVSLLSDKAEAQLGVEIIEFTMNGLTGVQSVRFDLDGDDGDPERVIGAVATVAVPRVLEPVGEVVVIAHSATVHLESLVTSLLPLQHLLTSDEIAGLITESA